MRSLEEVDSVFRHPLSEPSVATIGSLPYLASVILETLRLRPPAYIVGRCASRDVQLAFTESSGSCNRLKIPAGGNHDPNVARRS